MHLVILVFDKGYWKLERFSDLCRNGYRFVTLMKKGIKYGIISERSDKDCNDSIIRLSNGLELRLVQIRADDRLEEYLTNIFDLPPAMIKDIYGLRWSIETFFREINI